MTKELNPTQSLILRAIAKGYGKCSVIAARTNQPASVVSMALQRLAKAGLIKREKCILNQSHFTHYITAEGREALK